MSEKKIKLIVCNEPQNCGTVRELVVENQKLLRLQSDNHCAMLELTEERDRARGEVITLKSRFSEAFSFIDSVRDVLNHHFKIEWIKENFQVEDYDACDSFYVASDVAKLFREKALRGKKQ